MSKIKYFVMDVDGTLTDGKIYMGPGGEAMKAFNIKDGCGIHDILIPNGIAPVVLTGRESAIVINRCRELGASEIRQGVRDKVQEMISIACDLSEVAYIGDDINDLSAMKAVKAAGGVVGAPKDSVKEVLAIADFVADHNGGNGAVRDFIDWIIAKETFVGS